MAGPDLHDSQVATSVGRMRSTMAPWRDGGGNRIFSTQVFGPPFIINQKGDVLPWIATGITGNDSFNVWTLTLREDAVFQDGTPITAQSFKDYWEHGAKPENIVAWGGASLTLGDIVGWEELRAGDVIESEGLRVIDDQTLEVSTVIPLATWPLNMAAWHVGISKLDQVKADEDWGNAPIAAGPFSMTYNPDNGLTELTRVDLAGHQWNGPHATPIMEGLTLPVVADAAGPGDHVRERRVGRDVDWRCNVRGGTESEPSVQPAPVRVAIRRPRLHEAENRHGAAGRPSGPEGAGPRPGHGDDSEGRLGRDRHTCEGPDIEPDTVP